MTRRRVVAGSLVAAAALAVLAVTTRPAVLQPAPVSACVHLARLEEAMDLSSVGDQAVIRARAAALADALAVAQVGADQEVAGARPQGRPELAGRRIRAVLADPAATVEDLTKALEPILSACAQPPRRV